MLVGNERGNERELKNCCGWDDPCPDTDLCF